MKNLFIGKLKYLLFTLIFCSFQSVHALSLLEGKWRAIDTIGNEKMVIEIFQTSVGTLSVKIIKNRTGITTCKRCTGKLKNKPVKGMVILSNLTQVPGNPRAYNKGKYLDFTSGKVRQADIKIDNGGLYLNVQQSVKSQLWKRVD